MSIPSAPPWIQPLRSHDPDPRGSAPRPLPLTGSAPKLAFRPDLVARSPVVTNHGHRRPPCLR
ncbi:leucine-rich repeat extensin-like protein 3 [Iris pallida]|uniref:Leucine-rich repeat extensin-like protein 3 n=1 Tax=Iris pallida TaxID=29817 RepID=A0AAX6EHU7_IRIPA|nr:leucine-rich repeat extensin-like protein 3 [Iris pallida]